MVKGVAFQNFAHDFVHIKDPNERRRLALAEIDRAPFTWSHIRAIIVAGTGFFTSSYELFIINLVTPMLGVVYWLNSPSAEGTIPSSADTAIKTATSGGNILGMVVFGILADIVGRKKMYGLELIIMIIATLGQAISSNSPNISIVGVIVFWRVVMGIGIGGDYPLSAIITSEFATTRWRGSMMAAVFAMQGLGQFFASVMALIMASAFKSELESATGLSTCSGECLYAVDKMWRLLIGIGAIPGLVALYFRLTIPETPRYTFDVARDIEQGGADIKAYIHEATPEGHTDPVVRIEAKRRDRFYLDTQIADRRDFFGYFGKWKHGKVLLGTAGSWFFLDCAFYGLSLNSSSVLASIGFAGKGNPYDIFYQNAVGQLILVCAGSLPGYWTTVATVDIIGRKRIQLAGFAMLTLLFCIIGFAFHHLSTAGLFTLYVFAQFFFNFGPNATTFIIPGECFPTRYRSSGHGISAGSGKLGAIIAQVAISTLRTEGGATPQNPNPWLDHLMELYALFMLFGCLSTLLVPETKRKTLEEIGGEEPAAAVALETVHGRTVGGWGAGTNWLQFTTNPQGKAAAHSTVPATSSSAAAPSRHSNSTDSESRILGWKKASR